MRLSHHRYHPTVQEIPACVSRLHSLLDPHYFLMKSSEKKCVLEAEHSVQVAWELVRFLQGRCTLFLIVDAAKPTD